MRYAAEQRSLFTDDQTEANENERERETDDGRDPLLSLPSV